MDLSAILSTQIGKIIIGLLWGFGLASIFYNSCKGQVCEVPVYQGPNPETISKSIYQDSSNKLCYNYRPYVVKCPPY